jgi:hypothetical protein
MENNGTVQHERMSTWCFKRNVAKFRRLKEGVGHARVKKRVKFCEGWTRMTLFTTNLDC